MRRASDGEWFWRWADLPDPTGLQRFYNDRFLICNVVLEFGLVRDDFFRTKKTQVTVCNLDVAAA